jgi:septal ring factor EnvC (AmiA/AmiB activator)
MPPGTDDPKDDGKKPEPKKDEPKKGDLPDDPEELRAMVRSLRQENAGARTKNNELKAKADKFDALEEEQKSEAQKAADKLAAAEAKATSEAQRADRLQVALDKGLTAGQAKRLSGSTIEELAADADEILEQFPAGATEKKPTPPPSSKPSESLRGGTDPTEEVEEMDPDKLADAIPRP